MKITSTGVQVPASTAAIAKPSSVRAPEDAAFEQVPQTKVLTKAQAALAEMPDIDAARVAQLRNALERGEIKFDASKLARLIAKFHSGASE